MEMPEGFKKFIIYKGSTIEAAELLKGMAEALEYVARGPRPDDSDHIVAKQALKKFREWT